MSETAHWNAAVSGNFADGANWSTGVAPGDASPSGDNNGDIALLDAVGGDYAVTFNNNSGKGEIYTVSQLNLATNATLYVLGSKGMSSSFQWNTSAVNDGTIKIGVKSGGLGANFLGRDTSPIANNGLIIVKADGFLAVGIENKGVIQVVGGKALVIASHNDGGKYRIDGGTLIWASNAKAGKVNFLGSVNFNGSNGGTFEMDYGLPTLTRIAVVSNFSKNGITSFEIGNYKGTDNIEVNSSSTNTKVTLKDNGDYIRFNGDYTGDTFSAVIVHNDGGTQLLITASTNSAPSAIRFSQAAASLGATAAGPITATSVHSTTPTLLAASTHA